MLKNNGILFELGSVQDVYFNKFCLAKLYNNFR